jgi:GH25 family lysozyme M1 (1,4-beta-N-acetylmuramidase)
MKYRILSFFIIIAALSVCLIACNGRDEPKHIHSFSEWSVISEATCTSEGLMTRQCGECGQIEEHTVEKLMHELEKQSEIAPTCDTEGYAIYVCKCGYSHKSDYTAPLGHKLENTATPATCTSQGYTHYECQVCDYKFDGDFVMPLAHSGSKAQRFYATVRTSGYTQYTCDDCGHIYKEDYVSYADIVTGADVENTAVLKKGIDTSKHNHKTGATSDDLLPMDWSAIKAAGVDFVILRAGTSLGKDPAFDMDYAAAKAAGLEVGAYFYAYSTTVGKTVEDATALLGWLEGKQFEYPIYYDIEDETLEGLGKKQLTDMCIAFGEVLQTNGYYAAVYANNNWLVNLLDTAVIKSLFDVWYARYPSAADDDVGLSQEFSWAYGNQMGMWQYTKSGKIEGFECKFDFNYSYKDYASVIKQWKLNGFN